MAYAIENTIDPMWQVEFEWVAPEKFYISRTAYNGEPKVLPLDVIPTRAVFRTARKKLPDFALVQAWMVISHRLRSHIEVLEPGQNQFLAFDVAWKNGKPVLGPDGEPLHDPYYLVNVTTRFDAVLLDRSTLDPRDPSGLIFAAMGKLNEIVLDKTMVNGHHLWEGINHLRGKIMISDTLGDWIIANKMKGMELTKLSEE